MNEAPAIALYLCGFALTLLGLFALLVSAVHDMSGNLFADEEFRQWKERIECKLDALLAGMQELLDANRRITGITAETSSPVPRKETTMSSMTTPTIRLTKKSALGKMTAKAAGSKSVSDFVFVDNEDDTVTVMGIDAGGATVDISSVATLTPVPTSSDPSTISLDPPVGMTFKMHGLKPSVPGTPVQITATATWNPVPAQTVPGPFSFVLPCDVTGGPAVGIVIKPGTPITRP
jgi:hypothetical protein